MNLSKKPASRRVLFLVFIMLFIFFGKATPVFSEGQVRLFFIVELDIFSGDFEFFTLLNYSDVITPRLGNNMIIADICYTGSPLEKSKIMKDIKKGEADILIIIDGNPKPDVKKLIYEQGEIINNPEKQHLEKLVCNIKILNLKSGEIKEETIDIPVCVDVQMKSKSFTILNNNESNTFNEIPYLEKTFCETDGEDNLFLEIWDFVFMIISEENTQ